eukprot:gene25541-34098_t
MFGFCLDALLELSCLTTVEPFLAQTSGVLRITAMVIKKGILLHNKSSDLSSINLSDIISPLLRIADSVGGTCKGAEEFLKGLATITLLIESHRLSTIYSRDSSSIAYDAIMKDLQFLSKSLSKVHQYSRSLPVESSSSSPSSTHVELKGYSDKMFKIIAKMLLYIPSIITIECEQLIVNHLGDMVSGLLAASPMLVHRLQAQFVSEVQELSAERLLDSAILQLFKNFDCVCSVLFKVGEETNCQCQRNYTSVMKMVTKCTIMISREHVLDSREQQTEWKVTFMGLCDDLMVLAVSLDPDIVHLLPNSTATKLKASKVDAKKKGNSKSLKASVSSNRHTINDSVLSRSDSLVHSLTCLRMWLLLSSCSSPYMGAHGFLSSTSTDSHCVFLSSAMKALEEVVAGLSDLGSERLESTSSAFSLTGSVLPASVRQLYYLLDSQGRLPDQVALVRLATVAARLCGDCGEDISAIVKELNLLLVIKMTLHGLPQDGVICDNGTAATTGLSSRVNEFLALSTNLLSFSVQTPDEKFHASSAYVHAASHLIDDLSTSPGPLGERWANQLQCWLTITCAKTLFIGFYDPVLSYQWAKRFFPGSKVLGGIPSHLSADLVPLVLEAVLLLAELHEHTGNVDSCLSYISEAIALTKVQDRDTESCTVLTTYHNLVTLHAVRIWFRLSSPRFLSYLEETLIVEDQNRTSMKDDISNRGRQVLWSIADSLNLDIDKDYRTSTSREVEHHSSFRFVSYFWDLTGIRNRCSSWAASSSSDCGDVSEEAARMKAFGKNSIFHTYLPPPIRNDYLRLDLQGSNSNCLMVSSSSSPGGAATSCTTTSVCGEILAYDVQRDMRRKISREVLRRRNESSALLSFICGASSCFVSLESASSFSRFIELVGQSIRGDITSCVSVQQRLRQWLRYATPLGSSPSSSAVCFACIEPTTDSLIVGRLDGAHEYVVSIPIVGDSMTTFLSSWKSNMECGEALLQQTTDSAVVSKWTEKEKKLWWDKRTHYDSTLAELLHRLQGILGPWRFLFGAHDVTTTTGAEHQQAASAKRCAELNTVPGVNVSKVYQDVYHWVDLLCRNASLKEHTSEIVDALSEVILTSTETVGLDTTHARDIAEHFVHVWSDTHRPSSTNSECMVSETKTTCVDYDSMKVTDLRVLLKDRGISTVGKKADLIQRLFLAESPQLDDAVVALPPVEDGSSNVSVPTGQIVLILDESLQQLPWECMPYLSNTRCSRVPNLALLLSLIDDDNPVTDRAATEECVTKDKGKATQSNKRAAKSKNESESKAIKSMRVEREISARSCWYAVDIEGNLPLTRAVMVPFLNSYSSQWEWKGVIAELPSEDELRFFHENTELFIFCGHGAGDKMCESSHFRKYKSCPAALLWGCSSGHLREMGYHDPTGPAVHYLLAGAPFTLGNLWDVTDKDIDKLSIECMKNVFGDVDDSNPATITGGDICEALKASRNVCKLKNAVGCAPVIYGATASTNKKNVMYSTMRGSTKAGDLDGGNSIVIITIITKYFFVIHL